ncbi:Mitochondrial fission 1 protein, partial [Stegodyphus mimosarum]
MQTLSASEKEYFYVGLSERRWHESTLCMAESANIPMQLAHLRPEFNSVGLDAYSTLRELTVVCGPPDVTATEKLIIIPYSKFESVYHEHLQNGTVTPREQFDYAWCLIRSKYPTDIRRGVVLLEDLFHNGDATAKRDYLYYLAVGHTKLKDYNQALKLLSKFLSIEPTNRQAQVLQKYIKDKMKKEGLIGIAIVGGAALALGSIVGISMALAKKTQISLKRVQELDQFTIQLSVLNEMLHYRVLGNFNSVLPCDRHSDSKNRNSLLFTDE